MDKFIKKLLYSNLLIILTGLMALQQPALASDNSEGFERVVEIAFKSNPDIKKAYLNLKRIEGEKIQAGYLPNPEVEFEVENFGRGYGEHTFSNSELTFYLSQKIELGGKRKFRKKASFEKLLASRENYKSIINEKLATLFIVYNKTAVAKKRLDIAEKLFNISKENLKVVSEKVKYGKTSPIQKIKANLEFEKAKLQLKEAKINFKNMKNTLANLLGVEKLPEDLLFKDFIPQGLKAEKIAKESKILSTPAIKEKEFLQKSKETELKLTKSLNIPDLKVSVGLRKFRDTDQTAYGMSLGINLPVFNRNKGLIMKKSAERDMAYLSLKQTQIELINYRKNILNSFYTVKEQNKVYKETMLPDAEKAYKAVLTAYKEGKLSYLDLLDTQRTLIFIENEYLSVKEKYIESLGELMQLSAYFSEKYINKIKIRSER
ncbi:cobalt-zinc-cadmium resistance protein CzcC [Thermotomaculum hydrothermale]|uniref:Cobalt-zinc-cadmium resistance protein CzcC n=1 Tax=Thermotomaculum hydrothermale TaxID=981385 RepID=A0A7R6SXF7_9BACT|nr:TolC family protein [Thermotomaculum hydrothermale]BBB31739.1 cobalt-zinc-cadmium resistance protein CzcC [Thermotomaculum hydrothermale]